MKLLSVLLLALSSPALAAEALPDSAPGDDQPLETQSPTPGQPLLGAELDALFLQSPIDLERSDERKGMSAVRSETRYLEEELNASGRQNDAAQRAPIIDIPSQEPPRIQPIRGL